MKRGLMIALFILLCLPVLAHADKDIFPGTVRVTLTHNGEFFINLSENDKASYILGLMDGFFGAPIFGANNKYLKWISKCVEGKTNTQLSAILLKYLQDNPGKWDRAIQLTMMEALIKVCE